MTFPKTASPSEESRMEGQLRARAVQDGPMTTTPRLPAYSLPPVASAQPMCSNNHLEVHHLRPEGSPAFASHIKTACT